MYVAENPLRWSAQIAPSLTNIYDEPRNFDLPAKTSEGHPFMRSPIPPDPGYGTDSRVPRDAYDYHRSVRLHGSDAKVIYRRAIAQTGVPFFLDFPRATTFNTSGKGNKASKNYSNENLKRIRTIMRDTQKRQESKEQTKKLTATKELWHSKQYDHVESKVKQKLAEDSQRSSARPQSAQSNYLRSHGNTRPQLQRAQSASNLRRASVGASVDIKTTKPDYIKINSEYAKSNPKLRKSLTEEAFQKLKEKRDKELKDYQERNKGRLPEYLEKIKEARNQAIHQAHLNAPDPECPPGHVKIDNKQRLATLAQLESNRAELEKKLCQLPIRNDSVTLRRAKEDIEKKIVELDEAVLIFSKPKVFLKMDE